MATCYFSSPLGLIKLKEEGHFLTTIHFMEEDEAMQKDAESSDLLEKVKLELQQYFDGKISDFSFLITCKQPGTAFQQRVWEELAKIPFGKTISYRALAIRLGDEKCIRAAASANGQNNLAIAVPCHRVIGTDGSLTGYAGGLWRKKWLLDHEAKWSGAATQGELFG